MPRADRLGPALLLGLLIASLVAAVAVFRARTPDLALEVSRIPREITPAPGGSPELAHIRFFVRFDEPAARVEIVAPHKVTTAVLADELELSARQEVRCVWDGRGAGGEPAGPGTYRLRVILPGQDRDMVYPRRLRLRGRPAPEASAPGPQRCRTGRERP